MFRFAYPLIGLCLLVVTGLAAWWRARYYKNPRYRYTLVSALKSTMLAVPHWRARYISLLRFITILILTAAVARPQLVDIQAPIQVEGIDIMLVLDVSGSMELFDDLNDQRSRLSIAIEEAQKFVDLRKNDAIGLVFFARDVIARVPLTLDKALLKNVLADTHIGMINPDGTRLSRAVALAAERLRSSKAPSKIMILLTDGEPSPDDIDPSYALSIAKKLGIKIYTIGIGGDEGGFHQHPFLGIVREHAPLNKALLQHLATQTGGTFFEAKRPQDMQRIYATIDQLEKTKYEAPLYTSYYEIGPLLLLGAFIALLAEIFLRSWWWITI